MFSEEKLTEKVNEAVTPLNESIAEKDQEIENLKADLEAKETAYEELEKERDEMAKLTSNHKPEKVQKVVNDVEMSEEEHLRSLALKYNKKPENVE